MSAISTQKTTNIPVVCSTANRVNNKHLTIPHYWPFGREISNTQCCGKAFSCHDSTMRKQMAFWVKWHYSDVTLGVMASQITSFTIVYSAVYSGVDQRKHQSSASLAFVRGIHRWPVNSPHKWPVTRKMFHLMTSLWDDYFCRFFRWALSFPLDNHWSSWPVCVVTEYNSNELSIILCVYLIIDNIYHLKNYVIVFLQGGYQRRIYFWEWWCAMYSTFLNSIQRINLRPNIPSFYY